MTKTIEVDFIPGERAWALIKDKASHDVRYHPVEVRVTGVLYMATSGLLGLGTGPRVIVYWTAGDRASCQPTSELFATEVEAQASADRLKEKGGWVAQPIRLGNSAKGTDMPDTQSSVQDAAADARVTAAREALAEARAAEALAEARAAEAFAEAREARQRAEKAAKARYMAAVAMQEVEAQASADRLNGEEVQE